MGYSFAGHETFTCRNYWLKKGLDHYWNGGNFTSSSIKELGVGKNMVGSIRFWLKAFGLVDIDKYQSDLAKFIFDDKGVDPYLEDIGTIWLLHFLLVTTEYASIYSLVFNHFRKLRVEFTKEQLLAFLENELVTKSQSYSVNSLNKDISVFLNNYTRPIKPKSVEEEFMGLLYELDLIERVQKIGNKQSYKIESQNRDSLSPLIFLACLLYEMKGNSISFNEILNGMNNVGSVFALNSNSVLDKLKEGIEMFPKHLVYSDDGGVQVLQVIKDIDYKTVLNQYYAA